MTLDIESRFTGVPEGTTVAHEDGCYVIRAGSCREFWIEDGDTAQSVVDLLRDLQTATEALEKHGINL